MTSRNTQVTGIFLLLLMVIVLPVAATNETCTISVVSIPQGGTVFVDGNDVGDTPITEIPVTSGAHSILVSEEGYDDYTTIVSIESGNHRDVIANLQKIANRGLVTILTEPPGGDLYVDGKSRGVTPVTVDNLLPGRHEILIRKTGYDDYRDVVSVAIDKNIEYTEYLVPLPDSGFISITSTPVGADVIIDGRLAGKTPTNLQRIPAGNHTVELVKAGYWNFTAILPITGGESTLAKADLTIIPTSSTLYFDSSPRGLEIFFNGTFKGNTPATFDTIPPGDYLLEFRNYQGSVNQSFRFLPGATYEMYAVLTNESEDSIHTNEWQYQNTSSPKAQPGWTQVNASPVIEQTFTWNTNGHVAAVTLDIPRELYEYYKSQPHPTGTGSDTLTAYAINEQDRQYLHVLINKLKDASNFRSYAARNDYRNVVAFVQSIQYADDASEYWKYPIETLADGNGDCEDTAILTAALLKEMGYDVAVIFLPEHAAVAVSCENCNGYYYPLNGKRYYYLETTGTGLSLGSMGTSESKYKNAMATIVPL